MREKSVNAVVAVCKCNQKHDLFAIRFERKGSAWYYNWTFPLSKKTAHNEGYDSTVIKGTLIEDEEYPGCPYCGSKGFFLCGLCGKLTCWDGGSTSVLCEWCMTKAHISGEITKLSTSNDI